MNRRPISRGAWILLAVSAVLAGAGLTLPSLRPMPTIVDSELGALRDERDALAHNDDATLESLRQKSKAQPAPVWTAQEFIDQVGAGWRVAWQEPAGTGCPVLLTRSAPHLEEWPAYVRFVKSWTAQPGVVLESLDVSANGTAQTREIGQVIIRLRVTMEGAPIRNGERDAPSRVPLTVAAAGEAAATRKIGPVPSLRRPSASAKPPAPGPASAPVRPDPPGARAADSHPSP